MPLTKRPSAYSAGRRVPTRKPLSPPPKAWCGSEEGSRLDETVANCDQREFRLIHDIEFLFDVVEMSADGRCGKIQIRCNALYGRAACQAYENFEFPLRQPLDR